MTLRVVGVERCDSLRIPGIESFCPGRGCRDDFSASSTANATEPVRKRNIAASRRSIVKAATNVLCEVLLVAAAEPCRNPLNLTCRPFLCGRLESAQGAARNLYRFFTSLVRSFTSVLLL